MKQARFLSPGGESLTRLIKIDLSGLDPRVKECEILVACDVDNPLCGPTARLPYLVAKGATPDMVAELDAALTIYAKIAQTATGKDVAQYPVREQQAD